MPNMNKVMIMGHIGKDLELKTTPNGKSVVNFSVASSTYWTDKEGEKQQETEWHNIVMWGKMAENTSENCKKGSAIYVEGRLKTRSWDDKDGNKRYTTEIVAYDKKFLGGRDKPTDEIVADKPTEDSDLPF